MKKITETYFCDMCGKEIDFSTDASHRPIICSGYSSRYIPVHEHNPAYDEEHQDGISWECVDLCPECADRACAIQVDAYQDGVVLRSRLSWRTHQHKCDEMSEGAKRVFDRMMESANEESEFGRLKKAEGKDGK